MAAVAHSGASRVGDQDTVVPAGPARRHLPDARSGQSVVEFALVSPIIVIIMLALLNLGLAIRAHLAIAQEAQEAALYLVNHPSAATSATIVSYIDTTLGTNYPITQTRDTTASGNQSDLTVTVGTSCPGSIGCVKQDTVKIDYYFKVIFPLIGALSVGPFQSGGFINLGATASTVAATQPVTNVAVAHSGSTYTVTWTAPSDVTSLGITVNYCLSEQYTTSSGTTQTLFLGCSTTGTTYSDATTSTFEKSGTKPSYSVWAQQLDGINSTASAYVVSPS